MDNFTKAVLNHGIRHLSDLTEHDADWIYEANLQDLKEFSEKYPDAICGTLYNSDGQIYRKLSQVITDNEVRNFSIDFVVSEISDELETALKTVNETGLGTVKVLSVINEQIEKQKRFLLIWV